MTAFPVSGRRLVVLDSNVVSELMRTAPAEPVLAWVAQQEPAAVCATSVTLTEVRYGIARLPPGLRQVLLRQIAAICRAHRAVLATRNVHDFERLGLQLCNPWSALG